MGIGRVGSLGTEETNSCWICCLTACAGLAEAPAPPKTEDMMYWLVCLRFGMCGSVTDLQSGMFRRYLVVILFCIIEL